MTSKYPIGWKSLDGRQQTLEEMETDHLLNVYKHIENNVNNLSKIIGKDAISGMLFTSWEYLTEPSNTAKGYVKQELLSRGISEQIIKNHIEDRSKIRG